MRRIARWSGIVSLAVMASVPFGPTPSLGGLACTITGTDGPDELHGTSGNDVICGLKGDDELFGADGNDLLRGNAGDDFLSGGPGDDLLFGLAGDDSMVGRSGDDEIHGFDGQDNADGGRGHDKIEGQDGRDLTLYGGQSGADVVRGGDGDDFCVTTIDAQNNDRLFGGPGRDRYWSDPGDETHGAELFGACFAE
jgi:Ca2+-binding RTX toxin-like protein